MSHASTGTSLNLLLLLLLGSWWCTLELFSVLLASLSARSLALSLINHLLLIVLIKSKHLWRLFISITHFMILFNLMLHINIRSFFLLLMLAIFSILKDVMLLSVTSCLTLEVWSLNMVIIIICISKSFSCCMLHVSMMRSKSFRSLWSMGWVSQWLSFFNPLIYIS